jgi:hypothetical protein
MCGCGCCIPGVWSSCWTCCWCYCGCNTSPTYSNEYCLNNTYFLYSTDKGAEHYYTFEFQYVVLVPNGNTSENDMIKYFMQWYYFTDNSDLYYWTLTTDKSEIPSNLTKGNDDCFHQAANCYMWYSSVEGNSSGSSSGNEVFTEYAAVDCTADMGPNQVDEPCYYCPYAPN